MKENKKSKLELNLGLGLVLACSLQLGLLAAHAADTNTGYTSLSPVLDNNAASGDSAVAKKNANPHQVSWNANPFSVRWNANQLVAKAIADNTDDAKTISQNAKDNRASADSLSADEDADDDADEAADSGSKSAATSEVSSMPPSQSAGNTPVLFGAIRKLDNVNNDGLSTQTPLTDGTHSDLYKIALQKLSTKTKLTAEEFRSLDIGVGGVESLQPFFQKVGQVTKVYKDSPADKAGIKVGDKIIADKSKESDERAAADPTQPLWQVSVKREGEPVNVTIIRHNKEVKITLIEMNMEDIKEPEIRHMWEHMITELGYPDNGQFLGTDIHSLARTR